MMTSLSALGLLLVGAIAIALVSFPIRDAAAALGHALVRPRAGEARRKAALFWEAAARNLISTGALLSLAGFVTTLAREEPFPPIVQRMGEQAFGPPVLGLALAILCGLAGSRGVRDDRGVAAAESPDASSPKRLRVQAALGYALLAALLAWVVLRPGDRPGFRPVDWLLHAPAWLTVGAGAVAVILYRGGTRDGHALTVGLGSAGALSALVGLLLALHGFAASSIEGVAGGLVFSFSACVAAILGLVTLGLPREDRALAAAPADPTRVVWYGIPALALLVVGVAWLLVSTPMKVP